MTSTSDIAAIADLISRYKVFTEATGSVRLEEFKRAFATLKDTFVTFEQIIDSYERRFAPGYNVLRVLDIARAEVRTHSALLADFLNPHGTHSQGALFLDLFFKHCAGLDGDEYEVFRRLENEGRAPSWRVITEKPTPGGILDIVLSSVRQSALLVIENKIDARDQDLQLARYAEWLAGQSHFRDRAILYLTLTGKESSSAGPYRYCRLSYRNDVTSWMRSCRQHARPARVREVIDQYIDVLSMLADEGVDE